MAHVKSLEAIPSLKKVYIWSTGLSVEELETLKNRQKIAFETGFRSDTMILALNSPIIVTEKAARCKERNDSAETSDRRGHYQVHHRRLRARQSSITGLRKAYLDYQEQYTQSEGVPGRLVRQQRGQENVF
jgi:hypothetical protein